MGLKDLKFKPGIYSDDTDRDVGSMGFWKDCDKMRFRNGLPQTIGGWVKDNAESSMLGVARGTVDWLSLREERIIAFGTNRKLYIWIGGIFADITPIRASSTIDADPFTTTNGSSTVTVHDTAHGALDGAFVTFSGAAVVAGLTLNAEYMLTYVDADNYTITAGSNANASTTGGGAAVVADYQINPGLIDSSIDLGWGVGGYGLALWGTPRTSSDSITFCRTWSLDTWGEDLVGTYYNGDIFVWDSSVGTGTRATKIATAPVTNKAISVSQESRHLIAFGADDDPMLIRWCSSEDYNDWTPTATNTAGDWRIDQGNQILRAIKVRDQHLVFTDASAYSMQFVGPPYTFSIKAVGSKGLIGPNAAISYLGVAYWMGPKNFYMYDGTVQSLQCSVFDPVFLDFNYGQGFKVWAAVNSSYDEIWWLYCSASSLEIDSYVIYNVIEKTWAYGTISRSLFVGDSDIFQQPYAISIDGYLYQHEVGTDGDGSAIDAYIVSGDVEIDAGGDRLMHVSKFIPDFKDLTGEVEVTVTAKHYPQDATPNTSGAITVDSSTEKINPRVRGRQVSLRIESNSTVASWRLGTPRIESRPHGRR